MSSSSSSCLSRIIAQRQKTNWKKKRWNDCRRKHLCLSISHRALFFFLRCSRAYANKHFLFFAFFSWSPDWQRMRQAMQDAVKAGLWITISSCRNRLQWRARHWIDGAFSSAYMDFLAFHFLTHWKWNNSTQFSINIHIPTSYIFRSEKPSVKWVDEERRNKEP